MNRQFRHRKWLFGAGSLVGCGGLIWFVLIAPVYWSARLVGERQQCRGNLRELAENVQLYAEDDNDTLPDARVWTDCVSPYTMDTDIDHLHCPAVDSQNKTQFGYAMNSALSGKKVASVKEPATTPMLFDSTLLGWNAASGLETLPKPGRHGSMNTIAYCDGRVKTVHDPSK